MFFILSWMGFYTIFQVCGPFIQLIKLVGSMLLIALLSYLYSIHASLTMTSLLFCILAFGWIFSIVSKLDTYEFYRFFSMHLCLCLFLVFLLVWCLFGLVCFRFKFLFFLRAPILMGFTSSFLVYTLTATDSSHCCCSSLCVSMDCTRTFNLFKKIFNSSLACLFSLYVIKKCIV